MITMVGPDQTALRSLSCTDDCRMPITTFGYQSASQDSHCAAGKISRQKMLASSWLFRYAKTRGLIMVNISHTLHALLKHGNQGLTQKDAANETSQISTVRLIALELTCVNKAG